MAVAPDSNISSQSGERTFLVDTPFGRLTPGARELRSELVYGLT